MKHKDKKIEAYKLESGSKPIPDWFIDAVFKYKTVDIGSDETGVFADVKTLEGIKHASNGDYVIKLANGNLTVLKANAVDELEKLLGES